jgi:RNA polymerase sigma factor (sigma-70 family)
MITNKEKQMIEQETIQIENKPKFLKLDEYVEKAQQGDNTAREFVITEYYNCVKKETSKYYNWKNSLDISDLVQEGMIGVMSAIDKFNKLSNVPFDYYCKLWINAKMYHAIYAQGRTIRTPIEKAKKISRLKKLIGETDIEVGEDNNYNAEEISKTLNLNEKDVRKIICNDVNTFSINTKVTDESANELELYFKSDDKDSAEQLLLKEDIELAKYFIETNLNAQDKYIILNYFGIDKEDRMTLEEIGQVINMTKPGVRARKNKILERLKEEIYGK